MSWDVLIHKFIDPAPTTIEEIDESKFLPLGPAAEVRQQISEHLGPVDWSDPTWGVLDGDGFSIEFNAGNEDPIDSIMLHVRGGGDAVAAIMAFVVPLGWKALDISAGGFINPLSPSDEGWERFQAYRDHAMKRIRDEKAEE